MAREARVEFEGAVPSHARQGVQTDGTRAVELRADGRQMIAAKQIAKFATERLEEYRLKDSEFGGPALKSGSLGQPLLVQRLDRPGDFYNLTPWQLSGKVVALIDVDARFGVY